MLGVHPGSQAQYIGRAPTAWRATHKMAAAGMAAVAVAIAGGGENTKKLN